ncbi:hypothetical protein D7Y53_01015 [Stenotrophomonas maltophilia]|uniref:hypothetical protein n=1 Tax=Stenotrophomonas maltophilia TaxID=40324 RepID=UPI0015DED51D|nr:hypothetical protein [Stenotrophomonas maltophilia]MBA0428528.1 hypothetical protein [Stenotrophomonas maltophilia]
MSKTQSDTQFGRKVVIDLGVKNIGAGNEITVKLPQGAIVTAVALLTVVAFNSGTTATATISDGTTKFADAVDVKSIGSETTANAPKHYAEGGTLTFSLAQTGTAATAGRALAIAEYVVVGGGDEIYG